MSAKVISDLPADQMADIIRQSIRQQLEKGTGTDSRKARPTEPANVVADVPLLQIKPSYTIADFLKFHDEAFVVNAFVGLLQRKPCRQPANAAANDRNLGHRPNAPGLMMLPGSSCAFNALSSPSPRSFA